MLQAGTADHPLKVAIVGSGPSAFYACEALLKSNLHTEVDVFERLPTPYGLVRSGVAPDHPKLKEVTQVYERIGASPRFRYFGNVTIGRDIPGRHIARSLSCGDLCKDHRMIESAQCADRDVPADRDVTEVAQSRRRANTLVNQRDFLEFGVIRAMPLRTSP